MIYALFSNDFKINVYIYPILRHIFNWISCWNIGKCECFFFVCCWCVYALTLNTHSSVERVMLLGPVAFAVIYNSYTSLSTDIQIPMCGMLYNVLGTTTNNHKRTYYIQNTEYRKTCGSTSLMRVAQLFAHFLGQLIIQFWFSLMAAFLNVSHSLQIHCNDICVCHEKFFHFQIKFCKTTAIHYNYMCLMIFYTLFFLLQIDTFTFILIYFWN